MEIAKRTPTRSEEVIVHLKSIFSRHGIPELFFSDNGPQFSSQSFTDFSSAYGFEHVTSNPRFAQSNSEAKHHVQIVKRLLMKAQEPYLALLVNRGTATAWLNCLWATGFILWYPSTLLYFTQSCRWGYSCREREGEKNERDTHIQQETPREKSTSAHTWPDTKSQGTVVTTHSTPRSYVVDSPTGTIRRNRHHLVL